MLKPRRNMIPPTMVIIYKAPLMPHLPSSRAYLQQRGLRETAGEVIQLPHK